MKTYSDANPPKRGTGKVIYNALKKAGFEVYDLHYNANLWGKKAEDGWGTWACEIKRDREGVLSCLCGYLYKKVYLQTSTAPYAVVTLDGDKK